MSVIVPVHPAHRCRVAELLEHLTPQLEADDEIVLAFGQLTEPWTPPSLRTAASVRHVRAAEPLAPGAARNLACDAATKDIVVCQDADDLPHPQRIELLRYTFAQFDVVHVMHGLSWNPDVRTFRYAPEDVDRELHVRATSFSPALTNGNPAFDRVACAGIRWDDAKRIAEDVAFNDAVYARFANTATLPLPLYVYREHLSAGRR